METKKKVENQKLPKAEKIYKRNTISLLLKNGILIKNKILNVKYLFVQKEKDKVSRQILISISKKKIKHAVDRNKLKRYIREIYRKNKNIFLTKENKKLLINFIYNLNVVCPFVEIEKCILEQATKIY